MRVADLFCGPGGMSIGLSTDFEVTLAIDHAQDPCRTYRDNLSGVVRQRDIRNISGSRHDFEGVVGVVAGPPCRPFSRLNLRKDPSDPRRDLWKDFMRIVEEVRPVFFLMENVPTIDRDIKKAIIQRGKSLGYFVNARIIDSSDYGVPQTRRRWIVVGTQRPFTFPEPSITKVTVRDAFDRIEVNSGFGTLRPETIERLVSVPVGRWAPISSGKFANATRLSWDRPSPAIVNITKIYMVHPDENRIISESEAAVLQDFPSEYRFSGTRKSRAQQIADAAPSSLVREIAHQIHKTQFKEVPN